MSVVDKEANDRSNTSCLVLAPSVIGRARALDESDLLFELCAETLILSRQDNPNGPNSQERRLQIPGAVPALRGCLEVATCPPLGHVAKGKR
jgi:hypothetical protein